MRKQAFTPPAAPTVPPETPTLTVIIRKREIEDTENTEYAGEVIIPVQSKRFINMAVRSNNDFKFTDDHYNGYTLAFPSLPWRSFSGRWGEDAHEAHTLIYRVDLKSAAHVFVVDEQPYIDTCDQIDAQLEKKRRDRRTDREVSKIFAAIAKTLIPLSEYQQDYVRPFYLIGRPLKSDEARYYEPPFKTQIFNREASRKAASDQRAWEFMKEILGGDLKPEPEPPKHKHPHLRLV